MHDPQHDASPFNDLPPLVVVLALAIAAVEIRFQLGARGLFGGAEAVGWRLDAIERFGFFPRVVELMWQAGQWPVEHLARFLTYPLIHMAGVHALFAGVLLLALGKFVGERYSAGAVVTIILGSTIGGALAYTLTGSDQPLIGFYPPVYGLIGAYTFALLAFYESTGQNRLQAFRLIAMLLGLQLLFGMLFGGGADWVADLGGFASGFLLSFAVAPGGSWRLSKLLERTRRR